MCPDGPIVAIRGGGDLGSGCAMRLARCGFRVLVLETDNPLAVRRAVSFSEAVREGETWVEEICARRIDSAEQAVAMWDQNVIPVLVDPDLEGSSTLNARVLVDATMTKREKLVPRSARQVTVGLGPGFVAGGTVDAVVETNRGPNLGRVIWAGAAELDTDEPAPVDGIGAERVLRAPVPGILETRVDIGGTVGAGEPIGSIGDVQIAAPFDGTVRGLLRSGTVVTVGQKIGDIDPRVVPELAHRVSDKALAVAGGVLEAIMILLARQASA